MKTPNTNPNRTDNLESNLITARTRHIPYPLHTTIVTLLKHLQIPHQQPRACKHEQTKRQTQRGPTPRLLMRHASQRRLGREHILALSGEPRNFPDDIVMFGLVLGAALAGAFGGGGRVERRGDAHDDVRREQLRAVIRLDGDAVLDLCRAEFAHDRVDFEGEVDVFRGTVAH